MAKLSYLRRIVTLGVNEIREKHKEEAKLSDYLRVLFDGFMPFRCMVPNMVLVMTTKCSLKCEACANLMPYYHSPYNRDINEVIKDLDAVFTNIDTSVNLSLIGGEPFLYPDLVKVLDYVENNKKIMFANITSNGTIVPTDEVLEKLKTSRVKVIFSDYGIETQKIEAVKKLFEEKGIPYGYKKDLVWTAAGPTNSRGKSIEQLKTEYKWCFSAKYCKTILNGRLYACSRAAHLTDLGYLESDIDYFDLNKDRSKSEFRKGIVDFYRQEYCMACDHCDHYKCEQITPGLQAKGILQ